MPRKLRKKELNLLLDNDADSERFRLTRVPVNVERKQLINTMINNINNEDISRDIKLKVSKRLQSLYFINIFIEEDKDGNISNITWEEMKE